MQNAKKPLTVVIIAGPSLTGKSLLSTALVEQGFMPLVSTTTRKPRESDKDGVTYHFLSKAEFKSKQAEGGFLEHVEIDSRMEDDGTGRLVKVEGNFYGLSKDAMLKAFSAGKPVVVVCEPSGVKEIHRYAASEGMKPVRVFLNNTKELLVQRLLERFKEDGKGDALTYSTRLLKMLEFEQKEWVAPALRGTDVYDIVYPRFEADNQLDVVRDVMATVGVPYRPAKRPAVG